MATDELDPRFVVICQHGMRRVIKCRLDDHKKGAPLSECPDLQVVADSFTVVRKDEKSQAFKFNSPNDVVVHPRDGSIWFTDPIYGFLEKDRFYDNQGLDEKCAAEMGFKGVYRVDRQTKAVDLVAKYHRRPNGLAFASDMKTLWVSDSTVGKPSLIAYDANDTPPYLSKKAKEILSPETLGSALGTAEGLPVLTGGEGLTDGFKIDSETGYIWTSIPNGFAVIDATNNEVVCQILLGTNTSNVAFGTSKGGDVWLTGLGGIWRVQRLPQQHQ